MDGEVIETRVPARLDRLPWSGWHWRVVIALGITWLLDGLEVTLAGSLSGILKDPRTLGFSDAQIGLTATFYLAGAVVGALFFGYLTDQLGRKKLFTITLLLYLTATALTAFSWNFASFTFFRVLTGAGIGGEYAAINSAIDELIPARVRGRVDLIINSTFWIGPGIGSGASIFLLQPGRFAINEGWRFAFAIGALLGCIILFLRRHIPESPRWLMIHGGEGEAEKIAGEIENDVSHGHPENLPPAEGTLKIHVQRKTPWREVWNTMVHEHRSRSVLGFVLMVTQAFFYNAVFFTYGLVLLQYYKVPAQSLGVYLVPLAIGNFLGPLLIGRLFDTIGRKVMITLTYVSSGVLLAITSWLFKEGALTLTQASAFVDGDFLHRIVRRKFRVFDRKRDLSARDPRPGDFDFLCPRHACRRRGRTRALRVFDRYRFPNPAVLGLSGGRDPDDPGRGHRGLVGRGRRG